MKCYFQGCLNDGLTKEHIPPKAFFPIGEKEQLLTIKSCKAHNNAKSKDDLYVLAQICMNVSPSNRAREIFIDKIKPQLDFNNSALRKKLVKDAVRFLDGSVKYQVDIKRFDDFFTALSCGIVYKSCGNSLPNHYDIYHLYPNFTSEQDANQIEREIFKVYADKPMDFMEFGKPNTENERIYTVEIFGIPGFQSSITIVHVFF
ncbi:MAG: hypothetical protein LW821_07010 [Flammeovirgaceae bacterium]|jgi:hypothetical protein|nr:hypothetical protein [Flammeovirgaceae bacterium]